MNACGLLAWQALGAQSGGDHMGLRGGSLGECRPGGAKEGPKDQTSHGLWSSDSAGLWGGAWHAGPAILLVYCGVEKPSRSSGFRVLMFQLSVVLYLSQGCLQHLSKVPGSRSSHGLWLYPSHHLGSPSIIDFLK
jgi:hypothetical protein